MENSNGNLGHGDFCEYRMVVTEVSELVNSSFKALSQSFTGKFRRHFNSWSVNQIRFVTKQRLQCRCWRLHFVCYSHSNSYSVIIIGSYDFWVSNKCIHLIQNPLLLLFTQSGTCDNIYFFVVCPLAKMQQCSIEVFTSICYYLLSSDK
jgi:hypothetical protein